MKDKLVTINWVRDEIKDLNKVEHGGEIWRYIGNREILDFSSNVNPLGVSSRVLKVLRKSLHLIKFLPDNYSFSVREAATRYLGKPVKPSNIIVGNGSTELIHLFTQTFVKRGEECLIPVPTFSEYEVAVRKTGGKPCFLKLKTSTNFTLKIDEILRCLKPKKTKAIFLCNPNNPTSQTFSREELVKLVDEALKTNIIVFLDESYIEFSDENSLANLVNKYPNLFVLRSLTKIFGLMGLRIGYGVASEKLVKFMFKAKIAWNVNVLAQVAAITAFKDKDHLKKAKKIVDRERKFLFKELGKIRGFHVLPAKANFFLIKIKNLGFDSSSLKNRLLKHGILIRDCSSIRGLNNYYIRVSIKKHWENKRLLEALTSVVGIHS